MNFQERFKKLNKEQRKAVEAVEGPVMVIAGPGTGKTEIIGMRTAYICKEIGVAPENILITTFTESGARAIKERLVDIMDADAYKVNITTIHGFAMQVINEFPEKFIFTRGLRHISDIERIEILREILDSARLKNLVAFGDRYYFLPDILKKIQELKREDISFESLDEHLSVLEKELYEEHSINPKTGKPPGKWQDKEKLILKNRELSLIYKKYQEILKERGLYDYEDMILFVIKKFKEDDDLLASYQERYLYIMLDEYQDTNKAQNEIMELLTSFQNEESPNIFVVGDDDQSIYRFQGASLENILFFAKKYGVKEPIVLKENYRSTKNILDASFSLIEKNKNRAGNFMPTVHKTLNSQKGDGEKAEVLEFSTGDAEKFYIFKQIEKLQKEGRSLNETAIFTRTNKEAHAMAEFLARRNVPVVFEASNNILESHGVRMILDLLSIIENPYNDKKLINVMFCEFLGIDVRDVYKISNYLFKTNYGKKDKINLFDMLLKIEEASDFELFDSDGVKGFVSKILDFKKKSKEMTFTEFCEHLFKESGFLRWVYGKEDKMEYLRHISGLFSEIKEQNGNDHALDIEKFLNKINLYKEYNISVKEQSFLLDKEGARVMTAHKSKGLEFENIFITKAVDGNWGNRRSMDKIKLPENLLDISSKLDIEKNEDERRLFFVALTRAKNKAHITYAREYGAGEKKDEAVISQFIEEIGEEYLNFIKEDESKMNVVEFLDKELEGKTKKTETENEYLGIFLEDYRLSVTNLEDYLKCPKMFKFKHVLRVPESKNKFMALGTAYHKALEKFFLEFKNTNVLPAREFLISSYKNALEKEILTPQAKEDIEEIGEEGLKGYYDAYKENMIMPEGIEYNFSSHDVFLDDIPLTGKIDKFEKLGEGKDVKVVDYKTGSVKSKKTIEGENKNSDGALKRQIVFYKILSDADSRFKQKYNMAQGELDFVQGKDGKYKKELVDVSESDTRELKLIIKDVYKKIKNLEFDCKNREGFCKECEEYF